MRFIPIFENFESSSDWEYVHIEDLWEYREFDRSVDFKNSDSPNNIKRLEEILRKEGFTQPLILQYSKKYQTAYLTEGNHRLVAAKNIGIEYIPVRVTTDGGDKKDAKRVYRSVDNPTLPSQIGIESYDKDFNLIYDEDEEDEDEIIDINSILSSFPDIIEFEETSEGVYDISVKLKYDSITLLFDSDVRQRIEACESETSIVHDKLPEWAKKLPFGNFASSYKNGYDGYDEVDKEFFKNYIKTKFQHYLDGGFETPYDGYIDWLKYTYDKKHSRDTKGIHIRNEHIKDYKLLEGFKTFFECMIYNYEEKLTL